MRCTISRRDLTELLDREAAAREEICGLLLGTPDAIDAVAACRNVAATPATHFELDPAALIAAYRTARRGGPSVIGHYHSHPTGDPRPSATDAADAVADGRLWLILAAGEARLWRAGEDGLHGRFTPVELDIVTTPCTTAAASPEERSRWWKAQHDG